MPRPERPGRADRQQRKRRVGMSELVNGFDASMVDEKASKVGPAGIDIAYQRLGNPDAPVVLLIMGIAAQSIHWPAAFCHAFVEGGLQVIRFDNRDSDRKSTRLNSSHLGISYAVFCLEKKT